MSIVAQLKRVAGADDDATPLATHGILRDAPFVIGRQHGVDVRFVEAAVSRRHAVFQVVDGKMVLKNMSKLNPVSLNDTILDVETAVTLRHGDVVGIQLSSEEEATFIFEQLVDSIARSPLRENGGNTPMSVSPIKGSSNASMKNSASPGGSDENEAPPTQRRSTPRRSVTLRQTHRNTDAFARNFEPSFCAEDVGDQGRRVNEEVARKGVDAKAD